MVTISKIDITQTCSPLCLPKSLKTYILFFFFLTKLITADQNAHDNSFN